MTTPCAGISPELVYTNNRMLNLYPNPKHASPHHTKLSQNTHQTTEELKKLAYIPEFSPGCVPPSSLVVYLAMSPSASCLRCSWCSCDSYRAWPWAANTSAPWSSAWSTQRDRGAGRPPLAHWCRWDGLEKGMGWWCLMGGKCFVFAFVAWHYLGWLAARTTT